MSSLLISFIQKKIYNIVTIIKHTIFKYVWVFGVWDYILAKHSAVM